MPTARIRIIFCAAMRQQTYGQSHVDVAQNHLQTAVAFPPGLMISAILVAPGGATWPSLARLLLKRLRPSFQMPEAKSNVPWQSMASVFGRSI